MKKIIFNLLIITLSLGLSACAIEYSDSLANLGAIEHINPIPSDRFHFTMHRLNNNRILMMGGGFRKEDGSCCQSDFRASILDLDKHQFIKVPKFKIDKKNLRYQAITELQDGSLLFTGGCKSRIKISKQAFLFNASTNKFEKLPSLNIPRCHHSAVSLKDGRVLVTGGSYFPNKEAIPKSNGLKANDTAEIYDPKTKTFTLLKAKLKSPRMTHASILLDDGKVMLMGGELYRPKKYRLNPMSIEFFSPRELTFQKTSYITLPLIEVKALLLKNDKILIFDGKQFENTASIPLSRPLILTFNHSNGTLSSSQLSTQLDYLLQNPRAYEMQKNKIIILGLDGSIESCDIKSNQCFVNRKPENQFLKIFNLLLGINQQTPYSRRASFKALKIDDKTLLIKGLNDTNSLLILHLN